MSDYQATHEPLLGGRALHMAVRREGRGMSFAEALDLWQGDAGFRAFTTELLAGCPFSAFRWETPALTRAVAGRPFEFVLLDTPEFARRRTDPEPFRAHFTGSGADAGVVSFTNLGGDATLVVPSPRGPDEAYGHLAAFLRQAPPAQRDALWSVTARAVAARLGERPLWLSTAGGGVAWLHVRLDDRPKYYGYGPFRQPPGRGGSPSP